MPSNKNIQEDEFASEELRKQIRSLSREIADIKDLLLTLCTSTQFREDRPYTATLAEYMIYGEQRRNLEMVINAILFRAERRKVPQGLKEAANQSGNPILANACQEAPINRDEAIHLVQGIVGGRETAIAILEAHARAGYGTEGHAKLGI